VALLASDSFTGTTGAAWNTSLWGDGLSPTGSSSLINANVGRLTCGTSTATTGGSSGRTARRILLPSSSMVDAVALFKFRWPTGDECYPRFYCRSTNTLLDSQGGYYIEINRPAGVYYIGKNSGSYGGGSLPTGAATNSVLSGELISRSFSANTWYWCRFGVVGSSVRARIWTDGASEPTAWDFSVTDTTFTTGGQGAGFSLGNGSTPNSKFEIDDFSLDSTFSSVTTVSGVAATASFTAPAGTTAAGRAVSGPAAASAATAVNGSLTVASTISADTIVGYLNALAGDAGIGAFLPGNVSSATASAVPGDLAIGSSITTGSAVTTWSARAGTATVPMVLPAPTNTLHVVTTAAAGTAVGGKNTVRVGSSKIRITYRDLLTGEPCRGNVRFAPAAFISTDDLLVPNRVAVQLDGTGTLDVDLPCGKDQLTLPLVAYLVEELLDAPSVGRPPFYLLLTPADDGQIIDLATVSMEVTVPDLSLYMLKAGGTFTGPVTVASTLNATGNVTFGANLDVSAEIIAGSLELDGDADMDGSLTVGGSADIEGVLSAGQVISPAYSGGDVTGDWAVTGQTQTHDLIVTSGATIGGNVTIAGSVLGPLRLPVVITFPNGEILTVDSGALKFTGGSGTLTTIAPA
jgi:cytoskeletal protein CcmA (bactofilin family)